jgi:disulfide oxidoreductase YuzD
MASTKVSSKKSPKSKSKKQKPGPKSTSRRSKNKYPALNTNYNLKTRRDELTDIQDYAKLIPDDAVDPVTGVKVKEWLNSFAEEYVNANFKHKGINIMTEDEEKRERYRANNYRNNDIYSREKAQGKLNYIEDTKEAKKDIADESDLEADIDANKNFYYWQDEDKEES